MKDHLNKTIEIKQPIPASIIKKWGYMIDILRETFNFKACHIHLIKGKEHKILCECYSDISRSTQIQAKITKYSQHHLELNLKHDYNKTNSRFDYPLETVLNRSNNESYYELPIYHPDGGLFGTLSILHNNTNNFNEEITHLIKHTTNTIELDLSVHMIDHDYKIRIKKQFQDELDFIGSNKKATIDSISLPADTEQAYHFIYNKMDTAVIIFSPIFNRNGKLIDARYIDMNPSSEKFMGYKKEDVLGKTILNVFPETEQAWFDKFEEVVKKKKRIKFEQYHKPLGKYFSADTFPVDNLSFCMLFFDISIEKRLKEKITSSEKRYRSFFESLTSAIVIFEPVYTIDQVLAVLKVC
jgi:PAS domain S-box-containing protein